MRRNRGLLGDATSDGRDSKGRWPVGSRKFPFSYCKSAGSGSPFLLAGEEPTYSNGLMILNLTFVANPAANQANVRAPRCTGSSACAWGACQPSTEWP